MYQFLREFGTQAGRKSRFRIALHFRDLHTSHRWTPAPPHQRPRHTIDSRCVSVALESSMGETSYIYTPPDRSPQKSVPKPPSCLLSILNVVVDHVMMPPSPMEPMEFREVCRWDRCSNDFFEPKFSSYKGNGGGADLDPSQSSDEHISQRGERDGGSSSLPSPLSMKNVCIRVPIVRIFGPVLRGGDYEEFINSSNQSSSCNSQGSSKFSGNKRSSSRKQKIRIQQPQSGCLHIHGAFPYMLARPVISGPDGSMNHRYNCDIGRIDWDDANSVSNILEEIHCRLEMALRASYEHHNVDTNTNVVIPGAAVGTGAKNSCDDQIESRQQTPLFIRQVTIVIGRGFYTYCSGPSAPFLRVEYYDPSMRWRVKMILERGIELNELYHPDPMQYDHVDIDERGHEFEGDGDIRPLKFRCYEAHIPYTMQFFKDCNLAGMKYIKVGEARFRNPLPKSLRKRTKEEFSTANHANDTAFFFSHTVPGNLLWPQLNDTNRESKTWLNEYWLKKQTSCDLEFDSTVQQLLNVLDVMTALPSPLEERQKIHWRAVPSLREIWEQERKRMSILLPPENDFLSCIEKKEEVVESEENTDDDSDGEVIQRNSDFESNTPQFTLNVKKGHSIPGARLAVKGVKRLFGTSVGLEADFRRALEEIVSRHKRHIDDVDKSMKQGRVLAYNPNCITSAANNYVLTPDLDEGIEALAALGDQFSQGSAVVDDDDDLKAKSPNNHNPISEFVATITSKLNAVKNYSPAPLSQKDVEEEIQMLSFGNSVDDGDTSDEFDEEDADFLVEEERMGEAGLEKALTQLATQAMDMNAESAVAFGNETEDLNFEQNYGCANFSGEDVIGELFSDDEEGNNVQLNECTNDFEESQNDSKDSRSRLSNLSQSSEVSAPNYENGRFIVEGNNATPESMNQLSGGGLSPIHTILDLPTGDLTVEPHQSANLRCGEIMKQLKQSNSISKPWHTMTSVDFETSPPWFAFQWNGPGASPTMPNSFFEPVKRPPSYSQVKSWTRDQRKRAAPYTMRSNHLAKQQKNAAARRSIDRSGVIEVKANEKNQDSSFLTAYTQFSQLEGSVEGSPDPLAGLGHQGGLVQISTGGGLKTQINTSTTFTPLTIMSIEIHVQCRVSIKDQKQIAMVPDSSRDAVFAVVYVYCRDPGGGESLSILEKGCVLVMIEAKGHSSSTIPINTINATLGASLDASVEIVKTEANLLLRIASIVKQADPDVLVSWDTQGEGIGYLVERGVAISTPSSTRIDMARLLGRTPRLIVPDVVANDTTNFNTFGGIEGLQQRTEDGHSWIGSGLGAEWDDRVGSGAAASSIVSQHFIL